MVLFTGTQRGTATHSVLGTWTHTVSVTFLLTTEHCCLGIWVHLGTATQLGTATPETMDCVITLSYDIMMI